MKKRIFLTGASGFIGRNIVELLGTKYQILAPSHNELNLLDTEAVKVFMQKNPVDVLIHTANIGGKKTEAHIQNFVSLNLRIFFNIIRCSSHFKRMIYLGSGAEFGKQLPIHQVKEIDFGKRIPSDDFGLYKYTVASFIEETKMPIYNLRLFGIYGKYEEYRFRLISNIICQVLFDIPITIRRNALFDYLYIDDFIMILDNFINIAPQFKTYNVGCGKSEYLLNIVTNILSIMKKPQKIKILEKGFNNEYTCSTERLHNEIPSFKYSNFEETVKTLAEWYRRRRSHIKKTDILQLV